MARRGVPLGQAFLLLKIRLGILNILVRLIDIFRKSINRRVGIVLRKKIFLDGLATGLA